MQMSQQRLLAGTASRWSLAGFRVVVTGSTKGIGRSIVEEMLGLGAEVLLVARNAEEVELLRGELSARHPGRVHGAACDVSEASAREALFSQVNLLWSGVDGLINNVGTNTRKPIQDVTEEDYRLLMRTNLDSAWYLCKLFKPMLEESSKAVVVNVSSVAGVLSTGTGSVYAMSKAAMAHLSRSLACEWGPLGIRVNCVCPWMTKTPLLKEATMMDPTGSAEEARRATPLGRLGEPEDTAGLVAFLCTPAAVFVTGQVISVDGGLLAQGFKGPCVPQPRL